MTGKPEMKGRAALAELLGRLGQARVLCVGDVILDRFVYGTVERISPEAPIPVLGVERDETMLGGAGNVVRNLAALGASTRLVGVVGNDDPGDKVTELLAAETVEALLIKVARRQTSIKTRFLAGTQQLMRADSETRAPLSGASRRKVLKACAGGLETADVVVLSDYGKGVLADGVATEVVHAARAAGKPVVVDPKGRDYAPYAGADVVTPNLRELAEATGMAVDTDKAVGLAAARLLTDHDFGAVLVTRGADGMTLVRAHGEGTHFHAEAREVFDVSGAGDTVAAVAAAALGAGACLADAARLANVAAGVVVARLGTAAAAAADVAHALHHQDLSGAEAKILTLETALERVAEWRRRKLRIGFTNGCFDLLHPGHVALLEKADERCDRLIVGLNSDASVTRLKGEGRPIQTEAARAVVLASLARVDMVVVFAEDTPLELIEALCPEVLVKGADYALDQVVGADAVRGWGGEVVLIELEPEHSTTATLARMTR